MALARAIEDKFGSAAPPVHLIVYDPVAGKGCNIGGWSRDWWNIKVSSFTGFYARDEKTAGFSPTIPKVRISNSGNWWADEPRVELIGVRGTHSNLVGNVRGNVPNDPFNQGQSTAAKIAYKRVIEITLDKLRYMQLKGSGDWCRKLSKLAQVVGNGQPNLDGYTGWGAYSTKCQGMRIDPTLGQLMDTLTGRGVFIGDNYGTVL